MAAWLIAEGFAGDVARTFEDQEIDGDALLELTDEDLSTALGVDEPAIRARALQSISELRFICGKQSPPSARPTEGVERVENSSTSKAVLASAHAGDGALSCDAAVDT